MKAETLEASFSLSEARKICHDLFDPNPWIYWADLLVTTTIGGACYSLVRFMPLGSWQQAALFLVACLAFYRAASFIHELVHLRTGEFRGFRIVWNFLCGVPYLMPSFLYYTHLDHHRRKHYGTQHDGEYLTLGHRPPWAIVYYLSQSLIIPVLAVLRWMIFAPLAWLIPSFRRWVREHASAMVMDPSYVRPFPTPEVLRIWRLQELACFLVVWGVTLSVVLGRLPMFMVGQAYLTGVVIIFINSLRTLGAHRFLGEGGEMTFVEQLVDSVNYTHWPLITGLWAPVGLRFHALHHLFPGMPYHRLAEGHRRLMAQLPADSPYRLTESRSLWGALAQLWRESKANTALGKVAQTNSV